MAHGLLIKLKFGKTSINIASVFLCFQKFFKLLHSFQLVLGREFSTFGLWRVDQMLGKEIGNEFSRVFLTLFQAVMIALPRFLRSKRLFPNTLRACRLIAQLPACVGGFLDVDLFLFVALLGSANTHHRDLVAVWVLLCIVKPVLTNGVVNALIGGKMLSNALEQVRCGLPDVRKLESVLVDTVKAVDPACLWAIGADFQDSFTIIILSGVDLSPVWLFSHFSSLSRLVSYNADSISTFQHRRNNYCTTFRSLNI